MISGSGYEAIVAREDGKTGARHHVRLPVVCWVHVADGDVQGRVIDGGTLRNPETLPGFVGFSDDVERIVAVLPPPAGWRYRFRNSPDQSWPVLGWAVDAAGDGSAIVADGEGMSWMDGTHWHAGEVEVFQEGGAPGSSQ